MLPDSASRVLDIGAGTAGVGLMLARRYKYLGIEPDPVSFRAARKRIGDAGEVRNCGFEDLPVESQFDLVCAFEVLEHMDDDEAALERWAMHVRPGGWLLISVPKGRGRYGPVNVRVGDLRRYDEHELRAKMAAVGLTSIVAGSYGSPYGNVQEAVQNGLLRRRPATTSMPERTAESARFMQPPGRLSVVVWAAALPLRFAQRSFAALGIGTGLVCRGQRP